MFLFRKSKPDREHTERLCTGAEVFLAGVRAERENCKQTVAVSGSPVSGNEGDFFAAEELQGLPLPDACESRFTPEYASWAFDGDGQDVSAPGAEEAKRSFSAELSQYVTEKELSHRKLCKAAGIERRLLKKILSDDIYTPAKDVCIALGLALRLSAEEAKDLLSAAGYGLSRDDDRDVLLEYCFLSCEYETVCVNSLLPRFGQEQLRLR